MSRIIPPSTIKIPSSFPNSMVDYQPRPQAQTQPSVTPSLPTYSQANAGPGQYHPPSITSSMPGYSQGSSNSNPPSYSQIGSAPPSYPPQAYPLPAFQSQAYPSNQHTIQVTQHPPPHFQPEFQTQQSSTEFYNQHTPPQSWIRDFPGAFPDPYGGRQPVYSNQPLGGVGGVQYVQPPPRMVFVRPEHAGLGPDMGMGGTEVR